ncbi:MAG: MerR family transcriptional regulator [Desulfuromonadaceae bacterium]|nr:MerR family transcriptional regulator [Desulfuromonadaceae bacterium]MDD2847614.1 MerR family transcriptional regulator [Desulfuromonadaceae bacterium]MDD4131140.1 MerR family transcriptional regulator [Desulfuromonadaceae bacterium]
MSLTKSWYTIDEASSKYGVSVTQIQQWADQGLVRTEGENGVIALVNSDDIELKLNLTPSV